MTMADPFAPYHSQAQALFEAGDVVKAGQIWQAILKRDPANETARAGLYKVKAHFDARATQDGLQAPVPAPEPPAPAPPQDGDRHTLTPPSPELNGLLDAGCALYDAGLIAKAISTWEMALHQDPDNALARGYIDGARRKLEADNPPPEPEPEPAAPPAPAPAPVEDEIEKFLRDGCTLFDMGQTEDALLKWERILAIEPGHALAIAYANDARKDLGLPPLVPGEAPAPRPQAAPQPEPPRPVHRDEDGARADILVREGVQIYDMGMVEEAMDKWQQALALEPGHRDALGYLEMARRDREQAPPSRAPQRMEPAAASPAPIPMAAPQAPPQPAQDSQEPRILAAEHLLRNQKFDEAAYAFQRLMETGSLDPRVLQGYQQARAVLQAREEEATAIIMAPPPAAPAPAPAPVVQPRAVQTRPPVRSGLKLPAVFGNLNLPPWFNKPANLAIAGGALFLAALMLLLLRAHQRDVALKEKVAAMKADAMAPIARRSQIVVIAETAQEIRAEASKALADDPLTAYYRAQECVRLDPGDGAAAQLLERARARMAETPPVGSGADFDQSLKSGDLESARNTIGDQLRKSPDDPELKAKARTVYLALAQANAAKEHFTEARDLLLQGRAMFPQDKTWAARLKLLEEIQAMPKGDRANWIPLLG